MFHMTGCDVESTPEAAALRLVGHDGAVVGPVVFAGVRFWACVDVDIAEIARRRSEGVGALSDPDALRDHLDAGRSPAVGLLGCLVHEHTPTRSLQQASMLAGYAPRSILIHDGDDVLAVAVDAALLDQGVIVDRGGGRLELVATPGPRVPGHGLDARELALRETVYAAWLTTADADFEAEVSARR